MSKTWSCVLKTSSQYLKCNETAPSKHYITYMYTVFAGNKKNNMQTCAVMFRQHILQLCDQVQGQFGMNNWASSLIFWLSTGRELSSLSSCSHPAFLPHLSKSRQCCLKSVPKGWGHSWKIGDAFVSMIEGMFPVSDDRAADKQYGVGLAEKGR